MCLDRPRLVGSHQHRGGELKPSFLNDVKIQNYNAYNRSDTRGTLKIHSVLCNTAIYKNAVAVSVRIVGNPIIIWDMMLIDPIASSDAKL